LSVSFTVKEELSRVELILEEVTRNVKNCIEFEVTGRKKGMVRSNL
jgi:hypothetical protein